jgi:hypothetical protein
MLRSPVEEEALRISQRERAKVADKSKGKGKGKRIQRIKSKES